MSKLFLLFGAPREAIVSDNGREFVNTSIRTLVEQLRIDHIKTTPFNPQRNSRTERRHRDYNAYLRIVANVYGKAWDTGVYMGIWCLNARARSGTSVCLFEAL